MSRNLPSSSGLMRSTLRDCIKRLKGVRVKAGKQDEAEQQAQNTGDPFRDKSTEFIRGVKAIKELINERNVGVKKNGQDRVAIEQSNEIRKGIRNLQAITAQIKEMCDDADRLLARENKKKKPKQEKLKLLERQVKEREAQHKQCLEMIEAVRGMDAHRLDGQGKKTGNGISMEQEVELGKKATLRKQLNINSLKAQAEKQAKRKAAAAEGGGGDEEMEEGGGSKRLEDDPETKAQMQEIAKQEAMINAGLDRLKSGVSRLHDIATEIGGQLDMQNAMLDNTEATIDKQTKQLKGINRRLGKLLKEQAPMNMFINICCVLLLLGLVGYFLLQFGVI